jgi:2-polyprenyl-6-methoxyphenol hydroxylase-like FAD-dependent oxidoreductase
MERRQTTCVIVGGGPAGMFLGLLLARAGVEVTVLEKHGDFLRDFRGDTVHISTQNVLDELGLGEQFAALPQQRVERLGMQFDQGGVQMADMTRLRGRHRSIAMVPQWDLLDLLAGAAAAEPTFTLLRNAEVTDLLREDGRVVGVEFTRNTDGSTHQLRAGLTVACDGRGSTARAAAGLAPRSSEAPMDVWWFRLPHHAGDPVGGVGRVSPGQFMVMFSRGDYWQCGYLIEKGSDARIRAAGIEAFRRRIADLLPWVADRVDKIDSLGEVRLLDVRVERLRRWYTDGLLLIGDAAHAMSPVGGMGINLAVADAVAAARILGPTLRDGGPVPVSLLRRVQRRRSWPAVFFQRFQGVLHRQVQATLAAEPVRRTETAQGIVDAGVAGVGAVEASTASLPLPMRVMRRFPALQVVSAWITAIGPRPEHAPSWARRAPVPTTATTPRTG